MAGWYRQGTVALTPGSAAVAGAGTMWMGVVRPGSAFTTDGRTLYEIREVANDHTLTLDRPWEGETAAASAYAVIAASATLSNAELASEIAAMVAKWAVREDQYDDWLGGSPNGGPNADGKYPLTDSKGVTRLVESPARLLQLLDDGVVEHAAQIIAAIEDDVATARQAATDAKAAITAVGADRQAVAQDAATVAAQAGESAAAAATATAQAAIAVQRADEAANSAAAAAGLEASATAALAAAETARDIVLEARTEAGTAATGALSSRTAAEAARDTATAARDAALQARDAAVTARTQAQDWAVKTDAPVSGSLKSALSYALDAASQATVATGKATEAAGSAAAAAASATDLDTAATAAQTAAGDAATGAQTATAKATAAAISADIARSAAQQAEAAGAGSATARTAAEAARDSAVSSMTAAQVAASQAGQSQTNAANSAQTSATAAADAISAKSDAIAARDLAVAARTEAQGARDLSQAFAQGAVGYQPSPGVYSAFHWSEQAKGHAQTAATIVGGSNFGIVGDGASQRFAADNPGSLLNLVQAPGGKLTFSPGNHAVSFGFDAATAPVAASGNITAGTVQGALEEIDHRLSTLSQDSIASGGGSVHVTEDGAVEIAPAAGRTATYKGGELHSAATAYSKAQTDAAIDAMVTAGQAAGAAKLTTPRTIALSGGATGTATAFDGTQNIAIPVTAVAASALTGTIDIARLPAGALERLYPVASDAERFALTTAQVQKGDTVQVGGTGGLMYLVVDESNLGNAAGYRAYTAARASAVDWSGVENKPALLTSLASLDNAAGVLTQTGAGTGAKRAIGVASGTDIPDRAAADGRYAQLGASNIFAAGQTFSGTISTSIGTLAAAAGSEIVHESRFSNSGGGNGDALITRYLRTGTTTADWKTGAWEIRRRVDVTDQGFMRFGGSATQQLSWGFNATERLALPITGSLTLDGQTVWTAGNDGAGSGCDADLLDGMQPVTAATVNTIVQRDGSGNIQANGFGGAYVALTSASPNMTMTETDGATDGKLWIRAVNNGTLSDYIANDANNTGVTWRTVTRSGMSITGIDYKITPSVNGSALLRAADADTAASAGSIAKRGSDSTLTASAYRTSAGWSELGSTVGGQGFFASNLYHDGITWRTRNTHGSIGARALMLNWPAWGDVSIAEVSGATTADAAVSPIPRKIWHDNNLQVTVSGQVVDFKAQPTVNGQPLAGNGNTVTKSAVTVLPATGTLDVPAKSILAVYSQFVGQAFNVDYNTEAQYTQENAATGTDQVGGQFQLYSTAGGGGVDAATRLLIHADGVNGSTEIIDERGITPFGSHCGWFDGASAWKLSSGYKIAFGTSQNFTFEGMVYIGSSFTDKAILDICDSASYTVAQICLRNNAGAPVIKYYATGSDRIQSANLSTDVWYRWAVVRNNGTTTLYINGIAQGSWADSTNFPPGVLGIGMSAGNPGQYNFSGWQDQIRVSKVARYTANFTPPTTAFTTDADTVHLFSFDDGHGGQVLKDRANSGRPILLGGSGAAISSEQAKFGTTSFKLGTGGSCVVGWGSTPHADLAFGNDSFTVDFWCYKTNTGDAVLWSGGNNAYAPQLRTNGAGGAITVYLSTDNASWNIAAASTGAVPTVNAWNHIAITRSGTTCYVFLNGAVIGTYTVGTGSFTMNGPYHYFGGASDNSAIMAGYIDEVRIKRSEAAWISAFTPPTAAYASDARTVLLLHFDGANGDRMTLDSSGASYGTNAFGDSVTPSGTVTTALSATYTRAGHATSMPGYFYYGFAGASGANPSGHPLYFGPNTKLCLEGWYYFPSIPADGVGIFSLLNYGIPANSSSLYCRIYGGQPKLAVNGSEWVAVGPAITAGWNHIAVLREARGWCVYTNGVGGTIANPAANIAYPGGGTEWRLQIGTYDGGVGTIAGSGAIDSFRVTNGQPRYTANFTPATLVSDDMTTLMWEFNGAVGQKWVKELSQNTALITASGNVRTVKDGRYIYPLLTGANCGITTAASKFGPGSLQGNGTNGNGYYLPHSTDFCPTSGFTIDFWVNLTASAGRLFYKTNNTNATVSIYWSGSVPEITFTDSTGTTTQWTGSTISTGVHHVALVLNGTTLTLYVDGVSNTSRTMSSGSARQDTAGNLYLLCQPDGSQTSSMWIDEFRWSNIARWTSNFTPPTIPYGSSYVTGPFYVATLDSSRIDVSDWSTIHAATIAQTTPPGTSIKWLVSFDGRATWRKWDGSAWGVVPLNSGSSIDTNGNDYLTLQNALTNLNVEAYSTIDFAFSLKTANPNFSPSVDAVTLARDEYELGAAKIDYTIKRNGAAGAEIHRITNLKPYPVNVVYDYVA